MTVIPKVNYLTNKEILAEIHKSKCSYSYFLDPSHKQYDGIVDSLDDITPDMIKEAQKKRATRIMQANKAEQKAKGLKNHQIKVEEISPDSIPVQSLVWRVSTFDHIPLDSERVKAPKTVADRHVKLIFPPFKHYCLDDNNEFVEVARSHWKDGLGNGTFSQEHGKTTMRLAMMYMKLVERYSQRANWRGYTYIDEMRSQALLQLSAVGLQFDEGRSENPNPFAYYTVVVSNAFTRILNLEKKVQTIRDDILIQNGVTPSMTRQLQNEMDQKMVIEAEEKGVTVEELKAAMAPAKKPFGRGRPKKSVVTATSAWDDAHSSMPGVDKNTGEFKG